MTYQPLKGQKALVTGASSGIGKGVAQALGAWGTIDILVNNAGLQRDAAFPEMTLEQWNTVLAVNLTGMFLCARQLLTSFGLRSLAPGDPAYTGRYGGGPAERDGAYHQGTAWGWLLGPFALAHLRVYGDREAARALLEPMAHHLADYGLGSIAEIFDGDPRFSPCGCPAQAWSVAETLRALCEIGAARPAARAGSVPAALH